MRRVKILKIYVIFILFILFLIYANIDLIASFFMATLTFNIAILTIFTIGLIVLYQSAIRLTMLAGTFGILAYKKGKDLEFYLQGITDIMPAYIAHMFNRRAKKGVLYFTQDEAKNVTEWLDEQFFNQKGYTTFFVGTSLMLGLFGTFTGLLVAIDQMGAIILSFGGDDIDLGEVMTSFAGPLGGMSIGFASSLFGVSSAIILNVLQYLLTRNQATFLHDIEDWLKGKVIDSQSSEVITQIATSSAGSELVKNVESDNTSAGTGEISSGFLDVFVNTMGDFTQKLENSNKSIQEMFGTMVSNIDNNTRSIDNESVLLENMLTTLKELNVNQYSNINIMEESLQEISNVILAEHKTMKQSLKLQEEYNQKLIQLVENMNSRIAKLEDKR
jgi:hypothetical protein